LITKGGENGESNFKVSTNGVREWIKEEYEEGWGRGRKPVS